VLLLATLGLIRVFSTRAHSFHRSSARESLNFRTRITLRSAPARASAR
jgi:hypothetical protein